MQTIYIDVLIILNIYVNYFLLRTTAKLTHSRLSGKRCFFVSLYGSIYSLMILIPHINSIINLIIKLLAGISITLLSFGYKNKFRLFINTFCFFMTNFVFAGVIYAVYITLKPSFMHFNNTYFYVDFSLLLLIAITALLYFELCIMRYFTDKYSAVSDSYRIYIKYKGRMTAVNGLADTGNSLVDFFSGKPVIICSKKSLVSIIDEEISDDIGNIPKGFRLIPYSTIGNSGMLAVFSPDEVIIVNEENCMKKSVDVLIGIKSNEECAIFNPQLLKM